MNKIVLFLVAIFFVSCSRSEQLFVTDKVTQKQTSMAQMPQSYSSEYRLAPHDRISLYFFKYPELSTEGKDGFIKDSGLEVLEDGSVMLPLLKRVHVAGLTKSQLQRMLYQKYSRYLQDPTLRLEILNKKVYVLGEVKNPGSLDLSKYRALTPLKAIVERGGLSDFANIHQIKVLRSSGSNYHLINIDLSSINNMKYKNIKLKADDIVYVSHNKSKEYNGVTPALGIINTILNALTTFKTVSQ